MEAFLWGTVAASSLVLGAGLALTLPISRRLLGLVMGFGAGVLISAVAFELVEDAFETANGDGLALGLFAGSVVFTVGDRLVERMPGASGLSIVLGAVLDGIPESLVLGLTVLQEGSVSVALLVAVFLSNLPEAVGASRDLLTGGWRAGRILRLWVLVVLASGLAALAGYVLLDGASPGSLAFVSAFAAGAILTMLADSMMPEAFAEGGDLVGLVTTLGFALAYWISVLE